MSYKTVCTLISQFLIHKNRGLREINFYYYYYYAVWMSSKLHKFDRIRLIIMTHKNVFQVRITCLQIFETFSGKLACSQRNVAFENEVLQTFFLSIVQVDIF